ncbi:hypothetical protein [Nitrosomonas supralitoralis]|uniref:Uncharacterized protein n=1 Tax=Nitrosomonas supralitoralis TaxID=2116706 RepID=A0A2P7NTV4_9PROT|nr:hypothetical protein [Nitrosomonas supralitoralis]PSJ16900.1 hypothetical protein C7H79_11090 [Nitrosomonas supralitoralis]
MARIRTVKPEFWTSEQVVECSPIARLMFIGMWNFCDDGGNHPASFKTLKMEVFPGDEISLSQIEEYAKELLKNDLIVEYDGGNGRRYWHVTGWHHQKIEKPNKKHPPYIPGSIEDHSTPEGKVKEGKVREKEEVITHTYYPSQQSSPPTPAASVCLAIKKIGIIDLNPSHPELLMLIDAGATIDEFMHAARTAKDKSKGFAYVLGIVKGQRTEAEKAKGKVLQGKIPNKADALLQNNLETVSDWKPPEMRAMK